jgi:hypothetical protein
VPGAAACGRVRRRRRGPRFALTVWREVAVAGWSRRGSGVFARRERDGMGPGIGACVRLRSGSRGRAQGAGSRWWVARGPGPVLGLATRFVRVGQSAAWNARGVLLAQWTQSPMAWW